MEVQICTGPVDLGRCELMLTAHVGTPDETLPDLFRPGDMAVVKVANPRSEQLRVQLVLLDESKVRVASSGTVVLQKAESSCVEVPMVRCESAAGGESWGSVRLAWSWRQSSEHNEEEPRQSGTDRAPASARSGDWRNSKQLFSHTASSTHWLPSPQAIRTAVEKSCLAARADSARRRDAGDQQQNGVAKDKFTEAANIYQFPIKFVGPKETSPAVSTPRADSARASRKLLTPQGTPAVVKRLYPQQEQQRIEREDGTPPRDESRALAVVDGASSKPSKKQQLSSSPRQTKPPTAGKPLSDRLYPRPKADPHEEIAKLQRRMEELQADKRKVESMSQRTHALESLFT